MSHIDKMTYIKNNIPNCNEYDIMVTYEKMCKTQLTYGKTKLTCGKMLNHEIRESDKQPQIKYIIDNVVNLDDLNLTIIFNDVCKIVFDDETKTIKYAILLDILNEILMTFTNNIGILTDVTQFDFVEEIYLLDDKVSTLMESKYDLIFSSGFDKKRCDFYKRKKTKAGHLNVLNAMCRSCDYFFDKYQNQTYTRVNGIIHREVGPPYYVIREIR